MQSFESSAFGVYQMHPIRFVDLASAETPSTNLWPSV